MLMKEPLLSENYHISSLVAHVSLENSARIQAGITALPYTEIPLSGTGEKLVILIDAPSLKELVRTTDTIREMDGILSLLPVYQHDEKTTKNRIQ